MKKRILILKYLEYWREILKKQEQLEKVFPSNKYNRKATPESLVRVAKANEL